MAAPEKKRALDLKRKKDDSGDRGEDDTSEDSSNDEKNYESFRNEVRNLLHLETINSE